MVNELGSLLFVFTVSDFYMIIVSAVTISTGSIKDQPVVMKFIQSFFKGFVKFFLKTTYRRNRKS